MFYLVIVVTDRQTNRQTYAGDSIIPRESFRGDNDLSLNTYYSSYKEIYIVESQANSVNYKDCREMYQKIIKLC